jgi:O-antigen ligase
LPPFVFRTDSTDNFRLPKLQLSETLAGLALAFLAWRLASIDRVELGAAWRRLRREPALLAVLPLLAVAAFSALASPHPERSWSALASLFVGAALLVGLALALREGELDRLLRLLCWPAALLALLAILQFHDVVHPFGFDRITTDRLQLTSLAGGAFDLSGYLLVPALFSLRELYRAETRGARIVRGLLAALLIYGIAVSQTLTVLIGFLAGCLVLGFFLYRRHFWRALAGLAALAVVLVLVVPPLRGRVEHARQAIADQDYNQLLSGRLDGWRVAGRMLADHPLQGVGHGAYRSEFGGTKIELSEEGVPFFLGHRGAYFTNAHNDLLETGAELGWPGLLAALWGAALVVRQAWRRHAAGAPAEKVGLELAVLAAMLLVAIANFPFHVALIAYSWLIFLAGVLRAEPALTTVAPAMAPATAAAPEVAA